MRVQIGSPSGEAQLDEMIAQLLAPTSTRSTRVLRGASRRDNRGCDHRDREHA